MIGALSISGFPLFNGFISKSMIISDAAKGHLSVAEFFLKMAGIGTFLSVGLKLPYFAFLGPDRGLTPKPVYVNMLLAMTVGAICYTALGLYPQWLYDRLPYHATYHPYTGSCRRCPTTASRHNPNLLVVVAPVLRRSRGQPRYRLVVSPTPVAGLQLSGYLGPSNRYPDRKCASPLARHDQFLSANPFLLSLRLGFHPQRLTPTIPYNADTYRLPIGASILWVLIFFVLTVLYLLL